MKKEDIDKLSGDEQCFICENHLEHESYETIEWYEKNFDYCVWMGWL